MSTIAEIMKVEYSAMPGLICSQINQAYISLAGRKTHKYNSYNS